MRTIIEVPEDIIKSLDREGKRRKKSRAAIIREAICLYLDQRELPTEETAFGVWRGRGRSGLKYQEQIRSEWGQNL